MLETLLADGVIDEVLGQLKTGKEAEVWLVRHQDQVLAAKIYKERHHRNFKNNADYKEGRQVRNTRTQRAMDKGSKFGQQASEEAWKSAEADAMHTLHAAGVRVPQPVLFYEGVLLMEAVVDAEGHVAPRLVDAGVTPADAAKLYELVRANIVRMLCADLIHGDLSEFNVLLAWDGPVIIDFPQVVAAARNSRAEHFFRRDLENIRRFFGGFDPSVAARRSDADEIWRAYVRRDLTPDYVPSGRAAVAPPPRREGGQPRSERGQGRQGRRDEDRREPPRRDQPGPRRDAAHREQPQQRDQHPRRDEGRSEPPRRGDARAEQPRREDRRPERRDDRRNDRRDRKGPEVVVINRANPVAAPANSGPSTPRQSDERSRPPGGGAHRRRPRRRF